MIGTSWKMNLTSTQADVWFRAFLPLVSDLFARDVFVLPPFTSIWVARSALEGSRVAWGAQDVHPADYGPHTGDISAPMLRDLGCRFVEVGHAERQMEHGETAKLTAAKVAAVLRHGMRPILCVGESGAESIDRTAAKLLDQLGRRLDGLVDTDVSKVVIAYEPEWAIGEGADPAPPQRVAGVVRHIRRWLTERSGGGEVPVLYGGSVDAALTARLLDQEAVDGVFVGRNAMDPEEFARICWAGLDRARESLG
jgi:triosephosphate isomerase